MSAITSLTTDQTDTLFKLLAEKDLESRANSYFSITAYKINSCLDAIKLNGRQFNNTEKNIIANKAGEYSIEATKQIDKNLVFLASHNAENPDLVEKIQYIRGRLCIDNQPYAPNFDRKELTSSEIMKNYSDFERAVPKWADYMIAERNDLQEYVRALSSVLGSNNGSVIIFMFLLLDKFNPEKVINAFGNYMQNINFRHDENGLILINKNDLLKIVSDFAITLKSKQKEVRFNEVIKKREFVRESRLIVSESEEDCIFEERVGTKKDSKRVPIEGNDLLDKISNTKEWMLRLKIYYKNDNNQTREWLSYYEQYIDGKPVTVPSSAEEMKFYDQKIQEIEDAIKKQNIPESEAREFALNYLKELENEINELSSPTQFYGMVCPKSGLDKGLATVMTNSLRIDEDRLHQKYQKFLESRGLPDNLPLTQDEENELLSELHQWIEQAEHESISLLTTEKTFILNILEKYNKDLFDAFVKTYQRPVFVEKFHKKDKNDGSGSKYEEIKRIAYNHPIFVELDQKERALLSQKDTLSPAEFDEAISQIKKERDVLIRIVNIMHSPKVRNLKSREAVFKEITTIFSIVDGLIDTDLPVYFPKRLHNYLDVYHKDRMQKAQAGPSLPR